MLSKSSRVSLFVFILIFSLACVDSNTQTVVPTKDLDEGLKECERENYVVALDAMKFYCFSHPFSYYQDKSPVPSHLILRQHSDFMQTMETPISLSIDYVLITDKNATLEEMIAGFYDDLFPGTEYTLIPWAIDNEKAYLIKWDNDNLFTYFVFTIHQTTTNERYFYTLAFDSSSSVADKNSCASMLEELFFTVLDSFTYLK